MGNWSWLPSSGSLPENTSYKRLVGSVDQRGLSRGLTAASGGAVDADDSELAAGAAAVGGDLETPDKKQRPVRLPDPAGGDRMDVLNLVDPTDSKDASFKREWCAP